LYFSQCSGCIFRRRLTEEPIAAGDNGVSPRSGYFFVPPDTFSNNSLIPPSAPISAQVEFLPHQIMVMSNTYRSYLASYILTTGAKWKSTIKYFYARFIIDSVLLNEEHYRFGMEYSGQVFGYFFMHIKPEPTKITYLDNSNKMIIEWTCNSFSVF